MGCVGVLLMTLQLIGSIVVTIPSPGWFDTPTNLNNSLNNTKMQTSYLWCIIHVFDTFAINSPTSIGSWFKIAIRAIHLLTINFDWLDADSKVWTIKDAQDFSIGYICLVCSLYGLPIIITHPAPGWQNWFFITPHICSAILILLLFQMLHLFRGWSWSSKLITEGR